MVGPAAWRGKRVSKNHATPTWVDDIRFASKREAEVYVRLRGMEQRGEIERLTLQERFPFVVNGLKLGRYEYRADFSFYDKKGRHVVDVKGVETPMFKLKRALVEAIYGVQIEVWK